MSATTRFAGVCIRSAARRWPAELSDVVHREWLAELDTLRRDGRLGAIHRNWRQVAYAASLALTPAPEKENPMTLPLRARLPGAGWAAARLVTFLSMALVAVTLATVPGIWWSDLAGQIGWNEPAAGLEIGNVVIEVLVVTLMVWIGAVVARRVATPSGRGAVAGALARAVPVGLGLYLLLSDASATDEPWDDLHTTVLGRVTAVAVWTVLAVATMAATQRLLASARPIAGRVIAVVGAIVAADAGVAVIVASTAHRLGFSAGYAPAWLPVGLYPGYPGFGPTVSRLTDLGVDGAGNSLTETRTYPASLDILPLVYKVALPMLLCAVFLATYAIRTRRAVDVPVAAAVTASVPKTSGRVRAIAIAALVTGTGVWVYLVEMTRHAAEPFPQGALYDYARLPGYRLLAIVLVVLALVVLIAGRGPVVALATGAFAVMVAADSGVVAARWYGLGGSTLLAAVVVAIVVGGWWLSARLAGPGTTTDSRRRVFVAVAVIGAITPVTAIRNGPAPSGVVVAMCALGVALWLTAITAALAGRTASMPAWSAAVAALVPLAALVAVIPDRTLISRLYWPSPSFFVQAMLVVVALAVARPGAASDRLRGVARWGTVGICAAMLSVPLANSMMGASTANGRFAFGGDGFNRQIVWVGVFGIWQILLGVTLGVLLSGWAVPPATAAVIETAPDPIDLEPVPA